MEPGPKEKIQLAFVRFCVRSLNLVLSFLEKILFRKLVNPPKKILIFKTGNIGDIVCAIPSLVAIRKTYPQAKITLLTSPGERGIPGAAELLKGAWYIDDFKIYVPSEIDSLKRLSSFAKTLRQEHFDLFIHVPPHEWTSFRVMIRNMIFAKFLGVKSAIGFRLRVIINLFRKTQIDYTIGRQEAETLLELLKEGGIKADRIEFVLPIPGPAVEKTKQILKAKWPNPEKELIVALHTGTKANFPEKRWFPERFGAAARYLVKKYGAKIVIVGGKGDLNDAEIIKSFLKPEDVLVTAGELSIIESAALLKQCSFLLGLDSGMMHIMAAFGKPTVGLFSNLNIFGDWFPYGQNHEPVYHRFLNCDYHRSDCVKMSMAAITVPEVEAACDKVIRKLKS